MSAAAVLPGSPPLLVGVPGKVASSPSSRAAAPFVHAPSGVTYTVTSPAHPAQTPSLERPPLLSHNSTSTVSSRSASLSESPSDANTIYSGQQNMAVDTSTIDGFGYFGTRTYGVNNAFAVQPAAVISEPKSRSVSLGQAGSDTEPDVSGTSTSDRQSSFYDANQVKHRRRTTAAQLEVLDGYFQESSKPDIETRRLISAKLGMTVREVQVWFQNRRAKQKKLEMRAASAAEKAMNEPALLPAPLSAPGPYSAAQSNNYSDYSNSGYSTQPVQLCEPNSGYGGTYRQPTFTTSSYLSQQPSYGANIGYHNASPQAQIPRQRQDSAYLAESRQMYDTSAPSSSFTYPRDSRSISPGDYPTFSSHNYSSASNQLRWNPLQFQLNDPIPQGTTSVPVSPTSSNNTQTDDSFASQRRRSVVPSALSNLSGLSIVPAPTVQSPTSVPWMSSTTLASNGDITSLAPAVAIAPVYSGGPTATPLYTDPSVSTSYTSPVPTYAAPLAAPTPVLSPTAVVFPSTLSAMQSDYANTVGPMPAPVAPLYAGTMDPAVPLVEPYQSVPAFGGLVPFGPASVPIDLQTEPMAQMNASANIATRRQSLAAYPLEQMTSFGIQDMSRKPGEAMSSTGRGDNLLDDASLPIRRASTSLLGSMQQQRSISAQLQPIAPRPSLVGSPPTVTSVSAAFSNNQPTSPTNLVESSVSSVLEDTPILGGLQRGSINSKRERVKSATPLYQPYPQTHVRKQSTPDAMQVFHKVQ